MLAFRNGNWGDFYCVLKAHSDTGETIRFHAPSPGQPKRQNVRLLALSITVAPVLRASHPCSTSFLTQTSSVSPSSKRPGPFFIIVRLSMNASAHPLTNHSLKLSAARSSSLGRPVSSHGASR
jgi:hypothetical protein